MKVAELIEFLQQQPQDLQVAIGMYSEQALLDVTTLTIEEFCEPRPDGWIQDKRDDKPSQSYLLFPGN